MTTDALRGFADVVRAPEPELDLGLGALEIARIEHPDLVPLAYLRRLGALAARSGASAAADPLRGLHRLREFLFAEQGFRGNSADYYDPRNSCLNDVLDRRLGIPISLSVLLMEVGRRVGLRIAGIGLPGHFVVSVDVGGEPVLLDAFHGGRLVTREQAGDLVARALSQRVKLVDAHFVPLTKRQILGRMLANLRSIYTRREAWDRAVAVQDRFLVLEEGSGAHVRDRGLLLVKLGDLQGGVEALERYLRCCPTAPDIEEVRGHLRRARQRLAALN